MRTIVAIPACNEAERIESCLKALDRQTLTPDRVVLLVNNSTDRTLSIADSLARQVRFPLDVIDRLLPPTQSNAGHARRLAMDEAFATASDQDVLFTTDADAIVPPSWIAANLHAIAAGADVVCGRVIVDPDEARAIPANLQADDMLERRLIDQLDALAWQLDPEPCDPPPRHTEASGASLAVTTRAYHKAGGIPAMACGEDRAFVQTLWMMDAVIRHDPSIQIIVSGRIDGRARGGMADTIRRRLTQQDEFTDGIVEPASDAARRYRLRHHVRQAWTGGDGGQLSALLDLPASIVRQALRKPYFGATWAALEQLSATLQRQRVRFRDLPAEIIIAEKLLRQHVSPSMLAAD